MCFISAHTGLRRARHKGGFTLRSGMCQSRGSFPRPTCILALQYGPSMYWLAIHGLILEQPCMHLSVEIQKPPVCWYTS